MGVVSLDYEALAEAYDELYSREQNVKHEAALKLLPPEEPVLDAGCGTGLLLQLMPCYSVGLDLSRSMLRVAKHRTALGDLVRGDAERMPFRSCCFQTVYSVTVVHEAPRLVDEVKRVLKPGGSAAITLLKKKLELLPALLAKLPNAEVHDLEGVKDVALVYRARRSF